MGPVRRLWMSFRMIGLALLAFLITILIVIYFFYLVAPVYRFSVPEPFSGPYLYNPYNGLDNSQWHRAAFHIHSHAWSGITNGEGNDNHAIYQLYRQLGYDIICISDYMKINTWEDHRTAYIPVYEHGYGVNKTHQLAIGATTVDWLDFPFYQGVSQKQFIINRLYGTSAVVCLAHPAFSQGYKVEEMKYLGGYQALEVLNYTKMSLGHWDAALSSGRYVTVIGNDDAHDISNLLEVGHRLTLVNTASLHRDSIINAIKQHRTIGVNIFRNGDQTLEEKIAFVAETARLEHVTVSGDTLMVRMDRPAAAVVFIGQNGVELSSIKDTSQASYVMQPKDRYVRTEIHFDNGNIFYLNPVVRHNSPEIPGNPKTAEVDHFLTWLYRFAMLLVPVLFRLAWVLNRRTAGRSSHILWRPTGNTKERQ